jgi:DNA mismatch repair protein MutS
LLEEEKQNKILSTIEADLPLFEVLRETSKKEEPHPLIDEIKNIDVDNLSPREALDKLYELKAKL